MQSSLLAAIAALLLLASMASTASGRRLHNIYWNTTNPMFRIDNTDNVIDINGGNLPWEYDQANIICPRYRRRGTRPADVERYVIYNVSKEEYENCRITQSNPRVIAVCDKPHELKYFTITFRSFTPTPGGLEFRPGRDYYFISTSSRNDLYRRLGGRCSSHNMRVIFKVADNSNNNLTELDHDNGHHEDKHVNVPRRKEQPQFEEDLGYLPTSGLENQQQPQTKLSDYHSYLYPTRDIIDLTSNSVDHTKRSQNYANANENEVLKQASVMHTSSADYLFVNKQLASLLLLLLTLL